MVMAIVTFQLLCVHDDEDNYDDDDDDDDDDSGPSVLCDICYL